MSIQDLREFQDVMSRAYVRHLMFLATLPYYLLLREMRRDGASAADTRALAPAIRTEGRQ